MQVRGVGVMPILRADRRKADVPEQRKGRFEVRLPRRKNDMIFEFVTAAGFQKIAFEGRLSQSGRRTNTQTESVQSRGPEGLGNRKV